MSSGSDARSCASAGRRQPCRRSRWSAIRTPARRRSSTALTGGDAVASDALFVTLDPLVRKVRLPDRRELLVSDTVGFIERLPHSLVAAFRATLEEVASADLLLHVIDASDPERDRHMAAVRSVLAEVGADRVPSVDVFNKCDAISRCRACPDPRAASGRIVRIRHQRARGATISLRRWKAGWRSTPRSVTHGIRRGRRRSRSDRAPLPDRPHSPARRRRRTRID